jgi:hypothetical protein
MVLVRMRVSVLGLERGCNAGTASGGRDGVLSMVIGMKGAGNARIGSCGVFLLGSRLAEILELGLLDGVVVVNEPPAASAGMRARDARAGSLNCAAESAARTCLLSLLCGGV